MDWLYSLAFVFIYLFIFLQSLICQASAAGWQEGMETKDGMALWDEASSDMHSSKAEPVLGFWEMGWGAGRGETTSSLCNTSALGAGGIFKLPPSLRHGFEGHSSLHSSVTVQKGRSPSRTKCSGCGMMLCWEWALLSFQSCPALKGLCFEVSPPLLPWDTKNRSEGDCEV